MRRNEIAHLDCPRCQNSVSVLVWKMIELPAQWRAALQLIGGKANQAVCGRCGAMLHMRHPVLIWTSDPPQVFVLVEPYPGQGDPRNIVQQTLSLIPEAQRPSLTGAPVTMFTNRRALLGRLKAAYAGSMKQRRQAMRPMARQVLLDWSQQEPLDTGVMGRLISLDDLSLEAFFAEFTDLVRRHLPPGDVGARAAYIVASQWAYLRTGPFEVVPIARGSQNQLQRIGRSLRRDLAAAIAAARIPPADQDILLHFASRIWGGDMARYLYGVREQLGPGFTGSVQALCDQLSHHERLDMQVLGQMMFNMLTSQLPMVWANELLKLIIMGLESERDLLNDVLLVDFALPGVPEQLRYLGRMLATAEKPGPEAGPLLPPEMAERAMERTAQVSERLEQLLPIRRAIQPLRQRAGMSGWQVDPEQGAALLLETHRLYSPEFSEWLSQLVELMRDQGMTFEAGALEVESFLMQGIARLGGEQVEKFAAEMSTLSPAEQLYRGLVGQALRGQVRNMLLMAIDHPAFSRRVVKRLLDRRSFERLDGQPVVDEVWQIVRAHVLEFEKAYERIELARRLIELVDRDRAALQRDMAHPKRWAVLVEKVLDLLKFSQEYRLHPLVDRLDDAIRTVVDLAPDPRARGMLRFLYGANLANGRHLQRGVELIYAALPDLETDPSLLQARLVALSLLTNLPIITGQLDGWGKQMAALTRIAEQAREPVSDALPWMIQLAHLQARFGLIPLAEARALQPRDVLGELAATPDADYEEVKASLNWVSPYESPGHRVALLGWLITSAMQQGKIGDASSFSWMMIGLGDTLEMPLVSYMGRKNLAQVLYLSENELEPVVKALEDARTHASRLSLPDAEIGIPLMLGRVYCDHGDLEQALAEVQPVFERLSRRPERAIGQLVESAVLLAELYDLTGDRTEAERVLESTKGHCPATDEVAYGRWLNLSLALPRTLWSDDARFIRETVGEVQALIESLPGMEDYPIIADLWLAVGRAQLQLAQLEAQRPDAAGAARSEARATFRRLVAYGRRTGNQRAILTGLAGLAQSVAGTSVDEQEQLLEELRYLYDAPHGLPAHTWLASVSVARLFCEGGNFGAATLAYERAVQAIEQLGGSLQREESIMRFFLDKIDVYAELVSVALLDGREADAFHYSERAKSKALVRVMLHGSRDLGKAAARNRYLREVGALEKEEVSELLLQVDRLAGERSAMVEWLLDNRRLYTFYLAGQAMRVFSWDLDLQKCLSIAGHTASGEIDYDDLRYLHTAFWAPLVGPLTEGEVTTVCVVPHGVLHRLPLAAAWDEERRESIADRFVVSHSPSARILGICLKRWQETRQREGPLVLVPDPTYRSFFCDDEVNSIAEICAGRESVVLREATQSDLLRHAAEAAGIHFAGHAVFDMDHPMDSGLCMRDGRLTAATIVQQMRTPSRLIALSACETSQAQVTRGEEILGLPRALLYAGAAGLLGTFWDVDDRPTQSLMEEFYRQLVGPPDRPFSPARALREAQAWLRQQTDDKGEPVYSQPRYWAGFVAMGL